MAVSSKTISVGMIGDVLLHHPLYLYEDYTESFRAVSEQLNEVDLLFANLESMPGGREFGLSSYPKFNSPDHIIRDLKNVGVDHLSLANNHAIDRGPDVLLNAIRNIEAYNVPYTGAYKSEDDAQTDRVIELNGVKIGFLAYTYGMNGLTLPDNKAYMVSIIDPEKMIEDAKRLQGMSDLVIMSIHWGDEYSLTPNDMQVELSKQLADAGVDVIFGHHPHVIQPYQLVEGETGKVTHVFYSLGNFFSGQPFEYTNVGGIASVEIERIEISGKEYYQIKDPDFFPTAVVKEEGLFKVVPLIEGTDYVGVTEQWIMDHIGLEK